MRAARTKLALWLTGTLAGLLLVLAPCPAAPPRDELFRLVPDDVGLCFLLQDLRGASAALLHSPAAAEFRKTPLGEALARSPDTAKLTKVEEQLSKYLQIDWAQLRDDVLGDAVIFAYRPASADRPEADVVLVRARDAKLLARLVARLNDVQKQSGDLKELHFHQHDGREYAERVEKKQTRFYYVHGPVLAVSSQETMIRRVIDLDRAAASAEPPFIARELRRLGVDEDLAVFWLNPRAFTPELDRRAAQAQGQEAAALKNVHTYWKALEGIALAAALHRQDVEGKLVVAARPEGVPAALRPLFRGEVEASELWDRFPRNAILAEAGQVDLAALVDLLTSFLTEDARRGLRQSVDRGAGAALGRDVFKDVLPYLGPDWGFCVTAPPPGDKDWFPHMLGVLRVRPAPGEPPIERALTDALNSFALLGVLGYNSTHDDQVSLKTAVLDKQEVKYFSDPAFPPGCRPAFAVKGGYLAVASSPEAMRVLGRPGKSSRNGRRADSIPLVRFSMTELRKYVQAWLEPLAAHTAQQDKVSVDQARRQLQEFVANSRLIDRLEMNQQSVPGRLTLSLHVFTTEPLRNAAATPSGRQLRRVPPPGGTP
jgi:hypothetical protein